MPDALKMTITGRVMLVLTRHRLMDTHRLEICVAAVDAAVRALRNGGSVASLEDLIDSQIALLEQALRTRAEASDAQPNAAQPDSIPTANDVAESQSAADASPAPRRRRPTGNAVANALTMEEKLKEGREPVQKLLIDDCVTAGLIDRDKAQSLIAGMAGKQPEDAEQEIVEYLREVLLQQVKAFIRKTKGGPWATPRMQADLHNDIHHAHTVRGVLLLNRQIIKERRAWEQANGRGGILGLFAGRH